MPDLQILNSNGFDMILDKPILARLSYRALPEQYPERRLKLLRREAQIMLPSVIPLRPPILPRMPAEHVDC